MKIPLFRILKVLSAACFPFLFLPLLMTVSAGLGIPGDSAFWTGPLILLIVFGCLGMLSKVFLYPRVERCCGLGLVLANLSSILLAVGCGLCGSQMIACVPLPIAAYSWSVFSLQITAGIFCGAAFLGGSLIFERRYGEILTTVYFGILTGADAVCLLIAWIMKWQIGTTLLAVCYLIAAGVSAFSRSQSNIDFLMERRKHSLNHLPVKMRWYSLALVGGCFAVIVAGFLLRRQIADVLNWSLEMLRRGVGFLLRLISRGEEAEAVPEPEPEPPASPDIGLPEGGESSIFWTIFGYAVLAGALFLLYYYRHEILNSLRRLGKKMAEILQRFLFRRGRAVKTGDLEGEYEDDVQDLPREPAPEPTKRRRTYDFRIWKKEYRAFRSMPDSGQKAREGYRLTLLYLLLKRVSLSPSDTPAEILAKAQSIVPEELFRSVTESYRAIRYGEVPAREEDLRYLSSLLEVCVQQIH